MVLRKGTVSFCWNVNQLRLFFWAGCVAAFPNDRTQWNKTVVWTRAGRVPVSNVQPLLHALCQTDELFVTPHFQAMTIGHAHTAPRTHGRSLGVPRCSCDMCKWSISATSIHISRTHAIQSKLHLPLLHTYIDKTVLQSIWLNQGSLPHARQQVAYRCGN